MPLACGATVLAEGEPPDAGSVASSVATTVANAVPMVTRTLRLETLLDPGEAQKAEEEPAPQQTEEPAAVPATQVVSDKALSRNIVVEGSTLTGGSLKKRLRVFRGVASQWEASGHRIGVVIVDMDSGASVTYGADDVFYAASSVKGPYIISVFETMVDTGLVSADEIYSLVEPAIVYSDNDAYHALRDLCGSQVFADWCVDCGAIERDSETYDLVLNHYFPSLTCAQLAAMWEHAYTYFAAGSDGATLLAEIFQQREESPIRDGIEEASLTITKAGWYPEEDGSAEPATVDAGLVFEGDHGYVVAIMTDAPADLEQLGALVPAIYTAHEVLQ